MHKQFLSCNRNHQVNNTESILESQEMPKYRECTTIYIQDQLNHFNPKLLNNKKSTYFNGINCNYIRFPANFSFAEAVLEAGIAI